MAKKQSLNEGILNKFVTKVMDNIINNQRQKNKKMLATAHDKMLADLEAKAAKSLQDFRKYAESKYSPEALKAVQQARARS